MQEINVNELKPHPKNDYFFDDIQGENWDAFLESIKTSGVIEPIIVDAKTKTIVSGHQRIRACKELGIEKVLCEVRIYDSEDKILKDLLETNLRQRGIGNTNPIKLGRCLRELERIYGVRNGSAGKISLDYDNTSPKSQEQIAQQYNISIDKYRNAEKLLNLIPELQDMVQENKLNNAIKNNEKVYAENKKATNKNIKSIDDVIATMNEINEKYDAPITNIKTMDDVKKCMEQIKNQH